MKRNRLFLAGILAVGASLVFGSTASAGYFVRPVVQYGGGGIIDGYVANAETSKSVQFGSTGFSSVDLSEGTIRSSVNVSGTGQVSLVSGVMGDTFNFGANAASIADISFDFDGIINATAADPNLAQNYTIVVIAKLRVFAEGSGANYINFRDHAGALVEDDYFLDLSNPTEDIVNLSLDEQLSGSFTANPFGSYDVFAIMELIALTNGQPATVDMDFLNTGTLSIDTQPGVTFSSDSGVFPGSVQAPGSPAVPEPATAALGLLALGGLAAAARRRRVG